MRLLVFKAYSELVLFDFYLGRREFCALRDRVHNYPTQPRTSDSIEGFVMQSIRRASGIGRLRSAYNAPQS
jgi:hypothetical protein